MKKWSSQWTQFMQLRKEAWKKFRTLMGFEPVTSRYRVMLYQLSYEATDVGSRSILGLYVAMKEMIYEINHIWTAEMKWKWRNDRRSERSLCNCVKKPEKNSGLQRGLNPWPRDTGNIWTHNWRYMPFYYVRAWEICCPNVWPHKPESKSQLCQKSSGYLHKRE